jgi:integrase
MDQVVSQMETVECEDTEESRRDWVYWRNALETIQEAVGRRIPYFYDDERAAETNLDDPSQVPIVVPELDKSIPVSPPWERMERIPGTVPSRTVEGNVRRFLERKQQQAERGERSHGRFDALRVALEALVVFIGGRKPIENINAQLLSNYRDHLEGRIGQSFSHRYAKDHLQAVKQFVRWCWEQELIDLPRILESRDFAIAVPEKRVEVFTQNEVKRLLDGSNDTTKLYLLLMLNCGMQQKDIADLGQDEVDWKAGRITRKRSKTGNHKNVPEVSYLLWNETFRLLKGHRSNDPKLALTNRNGTPLKTEEIINGKVKKIDNIRSAFNRVVRKLADKNKTTDPVAIEKPLKILRKTAASKLAEHEAYGRFAQHFLGHAPSTVADRHYIKPNENQFDDALRWLGGQLVREAC